MYDFVYPAAFLPEKRGAFTVRFPDLPEAITSGKNIADAVSEAADCLQEALAGRIARKERIPRPSAPTRDQRMIPVALYLAPKLALYVTMCEAGINNSQLARRLGCTELVVRRMLNPKHGTRPERLAAALGALGKRVVVALEEAA
ncbi:MAG: type II toxin-antitoxin system HicB family antitoxin [Acidobacteriota bacterium]|mgnify:CR=1 FL=1